MLIFTTDITGERLKVLQRITEYPLTTSGEARKCKGCPQIMALVPNGADHGVLERPNFYDELLKFVWKYPDEVLVIGDATDVISATKSGIRGIRFSNSEQLERVMTEAYDFRFVPAVPDLPDLEKSPFK